MLLGLSGIKMALYGAVAGVFLAFVGYGVYIYKENQTLKLNQQLLENSVQEQQETIDGIKLDVKAVKIANQVVRETTEQQQKNVDNLQNKFERDDEQTIGTLALAKPGLMERVINNASNNARRCNEIAMGSPLTEQEINAIKPSEINPECPEIANPNYE